MSGDVHVRFCEGLGVKLPRPTRLVCCFQYYDEAKTFFRTLPKRLGKFNLELSKEKSRMFTFTRFETEKSNVFSFLDFEYYWSKSRKGKPLVKMRTLTKKFQAALASLRSWIKAERSRLDTRELFVRLKQKLQGHFNYYGVCNNSRRLWSFYREAIRIMYKWFNRRSQMRSFNWTVFNDVKPYIPDKLPIKNLNYERIIELVGHANAELARYVGLLQAVINPEILLLPLTTNEAVLSSKIEGTRVTFDKVLKFKVGMDLIENSKKQDVQEIVNYRTTLILAEKQLQEDKIITNIRPARGRMPAVLVFQKLLEITKDKQFQF